jgi:hypothetical protein
MAEFCPDKHVYAPFKLLGTRTQLHCHTVEAVLQVQSHQIFYFILESINLN